MNGYVDITDNDWFDFLSQQPGIDEVNFLPKIARQIKGGQATKITLDKVPWVLKQLTSGRWSKFVTQIFILNKSLHVELS